MKKGETVSTLNLILALAAQLMVEAAEYQERRFDEVEFKNQKGQDITVSGLFFMIEYLLRRGTTPRASSKFLEIMRTR